MTVINTLKGLTVFFSSECSILIYVISRTATVKKYIEHHF